MSSVQPKNVVIGTTEELNANDTIYSAGTLVLDTTLNIFKILDGIHTIREQGLGIKHAELQDRDATDQHTIGAISGLREELDSKVDSGDSYTKEEIDEKLSTVYKYKGTIENYSDLPSNPSVGDTYNIINADSEHGIKAGDNVSWNGSSWDVLAGTVDLSIYATKEEVVSAVTYKGLYDSTVDYKKGDYVASGSEFYMALQNNKNVPVSTLTYWTLISCDEQVGYEEVDDAAERAIGLVKPGISGNSYSGKIYYTLNNEPTINASTGVLTATGGMVTKTQETTDNSTNVATTEFVKNFIAAKFKVVDALPTTTENDVFYFVKETQADDSDMTDSVLDNLLNS